MADQQQQLESKFRALLDPIRDLAASWDIDIGDTLDEYLQELDSLNLVGVGGPGGVNFGKAALLIQGSTAVYGKKVEFLHQLVYQALDLISTKKAADGGKDSQGKKCSNGGKANASANNASFDEERLVFGSDPSFLLLDDVVEEGANIDLDDDDAAAAEAGDVHALGGHNNRAKDRRRSSRGRHSISGDFSRASTVLMHTVLQEDHGGACLRMSSCVMDTSGALMLGGMLPERAARVPGPLAALAMQAPVGAVSTNLMAALGADAAAARLAGGVVDDHNDDGAMDFGGGGWDDDHDGGDYDHPDDGYGEPADGGDDDDPLQGGRRASVSRLGMEDDPDDAGAAATGTASGANRGAAATRANLFGNSSKAAKQVANKHAMSLLDPHEVTKGSKPVKKGRPYKVPPADGPFSNTSIAAALASGDAARVQDCLQRIAMYGMATAPYEACDPYLFGGKTVPKTGLTNRLFAPALLKLRRDAAAGARSSGGSAGAAAAAAAREREASHGRAADFFLYKDPATSSDEALGIGADADAADHVYDDDDHDDGGFWGDDQDHDYGPPPSQDDGGNVDADDARPAHLRGGHHDPRVAGAEPFDIFQDVDDDMVRRVEEALNEGLSSTQGATYEAICRQHIDNFMRGAEAYARETQLSQRVAEWTGRLEPMLRAQESAPEFDIHTYSDLVLAEVGAVLGHDAASRLSALGVSTEDLDALDNAENRDANAGSTTMAARGDGGKQAAAAAAWGALRDALVSDASAVDFAEVVHATVRHGAEADAGDADGSERRLKASAEVCRIFLACLMLANTGNVEVVDRGGLLGNDRGGSDAVKGLGNFAVRLLENARKKTLENYRAPSAEAAAAAAVSAEAAAAAATAGAPVSKKSGRARR